MGTLGRELPALGVHRGPSWRSHARAVGPSPGESSGRWAPTASLLVANLSHRYVEDTDWEYSEFSLYDLGQAVAHMTLQAQGLDLAVRQFRAFDRDGLAAEFEVPAHWEVTTMSAIGRVPPGDGRPTPEAPAAPARVRRTVDDLRWPAAAS